VLSTNATLEIYPGAPYGLYGADETQFNQDLLDFIKA
jgi:hypothetical protein